MNIPVVMCFDVCESWVLGLAEYGKASGYSSRAQKVIIGSKLKETACIQKFYEAGIVLART